MSLLSRLLKLLLGLFDLQDLLRVGGDDLVFRVRGDDLNGHMLQTHEEYPLPHVGFEEQVLFLIGQIECFLDAIDDGRRLLEEDLYGRVGDDGQAVG